MVYLNLHDVGGHPYFIRMVKMAIIKKANEVAQVAASETPETVVEKRRALAAQIFSSADQEAKKFSFHVASQGGEAITVVEGVLVHNISDIDAALDSLVDGIFDIRAGVTPEELV